MKKCALSKLIEFSYLDSPTPKFEVILSQSMQTSGVVLADQMRVLDWRSRQAKFVEKAATEVIEEALAKASVLLS